MTRINRRQALSTNTRMPSVEPGIWGIGEQLLHSRQLLQVLLQRFASSTDSFAQCERMLSEK
jgi:hypothetical protein